jgi:prolyl oligopeptidase
VLRSSLVNLTILAALASAAPALESALEDRAPKYPPTPRVDQVDTLHGTKVADPYRWLEADLRTSNQVANWVKEQNEVTSAYLNGVPERTEIKRRLMELWNYEKISPPAQNCRPLLRFQPQ